jgi:hypothetical protein
LVAWRIGKVLFDQIGPASISSAASSKETPHSGSPF